MLKVFSKEMLVLKQIESLLNDNPWINELDQMPKNVLEEFDFSVDEYFAPYYEEDELNDTELVFSKDAYLASKVNEIIKLLEPDSWVYECDGLTKDEIYDKGYEPKKAGMIPKCK